MNRRKPDRSSWRRSLAAATILVVSGTLLVTSCSREEEGTSTSSARETGSPPALEREALPEPALEALREALSAYEEARRALASDHLEGVGTPAAGVAASLEAAETASASVSPRVRSVLHESGRIATSLSEAKALEEAREAFGELSRLLLVLANVEPRILEGWHVYSCPMTETFPKWMQPSGELENPFMGRAMPSCGVETDASVASASYVEAEAHVDHAHGGDVSHYTCSMHPSVQSEDPGTCPICSMDLVPVTREEVATGVVFIDAERRQAIGVRTAEVSRREVSVRIRAAGTVTVDETRLFDVTVKYPGYVGTLHASATGERVLRGEPLFTLYSPELYAAQEELLTAIESQRAARGTRAPERADYLVEAARTRLRLWDLRDEQIDAIVARGEPERYLPILSPTGGWVTEKNVFEGGAVSPGEVLYRVAALDRLWVEAELYESELPLVSEGQRAVVTLSYLPGKVFEGRVSFVYPYLERERRTGRVRVELPNPRLELKPEMYATVELVIPRGERLVVPEEAVLYAGPRHLVFLDLGEGRLRPQEIEIGVRSGDDYEVLSGLEAGDIVVTSGNFLVAAESRLKSAVKQW